MSDNIAVKDAAGATITVISKDTGAGVQLPGHHIADPTTPSQKATVSSGGALKVDGSAVTQPISGSVTALPGTGATSLGKAEDAGHTSGDTGVMALAVRNDGGSALAGTDGDYIPLSTDSSGALRVAATVTAGGGTQYTEDTVSAGAESLMLAGAVRRDTAASSSGTDGDYSTLNTDATGQLWTHVGTSALPSGASTAAKQPALGTAGTASADVITVQGVASMTNLFVALKVLQGAANIAVSQVTGSTSAATLAIARATRRSLTIKNTDAAITVYIGPATVTSGNGMPVKAGESITLTWVGLVQVIAASGSPVIAISDEYD